MIRGLIVVLLFIGIGCKSQDKGKANDSAKALQSQGITLLMTDNYGGSEEADFQVIRDMKSLRQFFSQVNKTRKPGLPVPEVDFSKEMLILHCPGKQLNGWKPDLVITENTAAKMVFAMAQSMGKQKQEQGALTMPFSLYKLPLTEKEIVLQKE